jgi:hypothetical protein
MACCYATRWVCCVKRHKAMTVAGQSSVCTAAQTSQTCVITPPTAPHPAQCIHFPYTHPGPRAQGGDGHGQRPAVWVEEAARAGHAGVGQPDASPGL